MMRGEGPTLMTRDETLIRTAVVEDDEVARDCLRLLIDGTPGYSCVGSYGSVEEALKADAGGADVLLLDINLPGMLGSEGARVFNDRYPRMHILMLTVYAEEDKIFESICNGACGYLLKKTPPARLLEAVREAHQGGAPMTPEIARKVVTLFQKTSRPERLDEDLTPHEIRLLKLLAEGYSYQDAADRFRVSINTLRNHIRSIYEKLHVHSKSEAVSKALRYRLIS
jgi:DNA-binding NarL/FixJ family response regulator